MFLIWVLEGLSGAWSYNVLILIFLNHVVALKVIEIVKLVELVV